MEARLRKRPSRFNGLLPVDEGDEEDEEHLGAPEMLVQLNLRLVKKRGDGGCWVAATCHNMYRDDDASNKAVRQKVSDLYASQGACMAAHVGTHMKCCKYRPYGHACWAQMPQSSGAFVRM